ncbi:PQQ-dependent sugar dehydrogenase [Alteromonas facilis]|uniref:PQQ-dependent sugar dehydrogenase n=1 Tax=Alteromonas facilis TaxID=2048004 RepID=UPI000C288CC6|nr:PQQ-dependent sugar dehydrogenase [Alteromonas facilis]
MFQPFVMSNIRLLSFAFLINAVISIGIQAHANTANEMFPEVSITPFHSSLINPWAIKQLPTEEWLITLKQGQIRLVSKDGEPLAEFTHMPDDLYVAGQGGLMDVALHPDFNQKPFVYITYAEGTADANHLAVARATYTQKTLGDWEVIFRAEPDRATPVHYAGRMAFLADSSLLVTSGDGFDYREQAQVKSSHLGKVLRMSDSGTPLADNPYYKGNGSPIDYVYTLGHRNAQGLEVDSTSNLIYLNEHGPAGGDEINILRAGQNYGWPVVTQGKDYSGANITPFDDYPGMRAPIVNWTPSIAPSSMTVVHGDLYSALEGDLLVTSLAAKRLYWVRIVNQKSVFAMPVVDDLQQRLRDIHMGLDGAVYILTDGPEASILKMLPK